MRRKVFVIATSGALLVALVAAGVFAFGTRGASASQTTYDINTLAGKVASVHGTAGLQIRFSAFIEEEAEEEASPTPNTPPINPPFVLSSPLDGSSVAAPNVTVNQDTAGGPQNETAIAVDPNNPHRVVVAFASSGIVFSAGLGFDRAAPPNPVAVNRGTFDGGGNLSWSAPTFINQTTSPSTLNDKEWIGADAHAASPFHDRVYVSWTRFIFNAHNGNFVQSPIFFAYSTDHGATFSAPQNIVGTVHYDQGSRIVVGADGTVYVFYEGSTRLATLSSTYMVKSTDGGVTFSKPVAIAPLQDIASPANTVFRVNSFPAADIAPNGALYAAWSSQMNNGGGLCATPSNNGCHAAALYNKSPDGGAPWTSPVPISAALAPSTPPAGRHPAGRRCPP